MFCKNCGNEIQGEKFCGKCGNKVDLNVEKETNNIKKKRNIKPIYLIIGIIAIILIISMVIMINNNNKEVVKQASAQVETEEQKQERLKKQEENNKISNAITQFGEIVRTDNQGSVKYSSYSLYKTTSNGTKIYKVKYSTSSSQNEYLRKFYYQLVSLNEENTAVVKSTKLYQSLEENDGSKTFDNYSMEYEAERIWGK